MDSGLVVIQKKNGKSGITVDFLFFVNVLTIKEDSFLVVLFLQMRSTYGQKTHAPVWSFASCHSDPWIKSLLL